jgi:hypothetical protein
VVLLLGRLTGSRLETSEHRLGAGHHAKHRPDSSDTRSRCRAGAASVPAMQIGFAVQHCGCLRVSSESDAGVDVGAHFRFRLMVSDDVGNIRTRACSSPVQTRA